MTDGTSSCVVFLTQDGTILEDVTPLSLVDAVTYDSLSSKGGLATVKTDSSSSLRRQDSTSRVLQGSGGGGGLWEMLGQ